MNFRIDYPFNPQIPKGMYLPDFQTIVDALTLTEKNLLAQGYKSEPDEEFYVRVQDQPHFNGDTLVSASMGEDAIIFPSNHAWDDVMIYVLIMKALGVADSSIL